MRKSTATKFAIAIVIFFLSFGYARAATYTRSPIGIDISDPVHIVASADLLDSSNCDAQPASYVGIIYGSDNTVGENFFGSPVAYTGIGLYNLDRTESLPVDTGYYFYIGCSITSPSVSGDSGIIYDPDDVGVTISEQQGASAGSVNLWLPTDHVSLTAAATDVGTVSSGMIGALWPFFILFIGIAWVAFFFEKGKGVQKGIEKESKKDEKLAAIKATTDHMKNEHRGDKIVEKLSRPLKRPLAM